jgi:hypothetical protein
MEAILVETFQPKAARRLYDTTGDYRNKAGTIFAVNEGLSVLGNVTVGGGKQVKAAGKCLLGKLGSPLRGGVGYKSFDAFKKAQGPAGAGKVWGHLVEQCQANCTRAGYPSRMINNTKNVIKMSKEVNQGMANFYSSKPGGIFGKQTLRDWLSGNESSWRCRHNSDQDWGLV